MMTERTITRRTFLRSRVSVIAGLAILGAGCSGDLSSVGEESLPIVQMKFAKCTGSSTSQVYNRLFSMFVHMRAGAVIGFKPNGTISRMVVQGWSSPFYEPRAMYCKWKNQSSDVFSSGWVTSSYVTPEEAFVTILLDTGSRSVPIDENDIHEAVSVHGFEIDNVVDANSAAIKAIAASRKQRSNKRVLTLLHFSDIHGDAYQLSRIVEFAERTGLIDDAIHSGDMMLQSYDELVKTFKGTDTTTETEYYWWDYAKAGRVLNCIGNHDLKIEGKPWTGSDVQPSTADAFNRYFAPYYGSWNVIWGDETTPSNAMYYYKDYNIELADEGIRLVVLDENSKSDSSKAMYQVTQVQWFEGVLDDAIENNLAVIVVQHYPFRQDETERITCSFTQKDISTSDANTVAPAFEDAVNRFIQNGGEFICWMAGHLHRDVVQVKNGQLLLDIGSASCMTANTRTYSDLARSVGDATCDCFNVVTVDRDAKHLKIVRVGSDRNYAMEPRFAICFNYATATVVYDNM